MTSPNEYSQKPAPHTPRDRLRRLLLESEGLITAQRVSKELDITTQQAGALLREYRTMEVY